MRIDRTFSFVLCLSLTTTGLAAKLPPLPKLFHITVDQAQLIVIASITEYVPDPGTTLPEPNSNLQVLDRIDPNELPALLAFRRPGKYSFQCLRILKGQGDLQLNIHLPLLSTLGYGRKFDLPRGSRVMLLLNKTRDNDWQPVDPQMPLVPVLANLDINRQDLDAFDIMLSLVLDEAWRSRAASLLSETKNDRVAKEMKRFVDDKDLGVQANVLTCLAVNQDLSAISRIANMAKQSTAAPTRALQFYKQPEAVALLNPLIVDGTDLVRLNAMQALRDIADKSSVPFLMRALETDDKQHMVSYGAYWTIHRLEPSLGPARFRDDFYLHREAEIQLLKQWWEWEQIKAKKAASATAPATSTQPTGK